MNALVRHIHQFRVGRHAELEVPAGDGPGPPPEGLPALRVTPLEARSAFLYAVSGEG